VHAARGDESAGVLINGEMRHVGATVFGPPEHARKHHHDGYGWQVSWEGDSEMNVHPRRWKFRKALDLSGSAFFFPQPGEDQFLSNDSIFIFCFSDSILSSPLRSERHLKHRNIWMSTEGDR